MSTSTDDLFPVPSSPPATLIPVHWPGINPESITALREVLKDNHERWHAFFNDQGFHKYVAVTAFTGLSRFSHVNTLVIQVTVPSPFGLLVQTLPS
jgi:hypothetical protein